MASEPGGARENAILERTQTLNVKLQGLQNLLERSFNRSRPGDEKTVAVEAVAPNVLDEISDNLVSADLKVTHLHEFVVQAVVNKVHIT